MNPRKPTLACQPQPSTGIVRVGLKPKSAVTRSIDDDDDPYIPFSAHIRLSTYAMLRQAAFWASGFGEMRTHIDTILKDYFAQFPESEIPLPDDVRKKYKYLK
jgi:hypothetical protein